MFNSGYRGRRSPDNAGAINPQIKYTQVVYPIPTITSWSISGSDDTALNPAGGQTVLVNGTGFAVGCAATLNGATISPVTLVSPTQISFTSPANAGGTYSLVVYNSTGGAAILVPGLTYSSVPTWTTPAGSIGSYTETTAINTAVVATSDSAMTYTLSSGSLPSGSTLYANGVITGTAPVDSSSTTYTFGVTATDVELQDTTRTFTLTINVDVVTWVTPASGATITLDGTAYSQALSATDLAGYAVSYTANALPTGLTLSAGTISGTPTTEGNTSSLLTATAATTNRSSTNTVTWVVVLGDSYFKYVTTLLSADPSYTVPSFANDNSLVNNQLVVYGDTRAQNLNPYQPGYYSVYHGTTANGWQTPANSQTNIMGTATLNSSSTFTVEAWIYPLSRHSGGGAVLGYVFGSMAIAGSQVDWSIGPDSNGKLTVFWYNSGNFVCNSTNVIALNAWTHIAVSVNVGAISLFINGTKETLSGTTTATTTSGTTLTYVSSGGYNYAGTTWQGFNGYISNLRVVKGQALYSVSFTPSTTPLLAIPGTTLLMDWFGRFADASPSNYAITLTNSPQISAATPFVTVYQSDTQYYGASLDGSGDYLTVPDSSGFEPFAGDFTLECWFYPVGSNAANGSGLLSKSNASSYGPYSLSFTAAGLFQALSSTNGSTWGIQLISSVNYSTLQNKWNHAAYVRSGVLFTLYLNGRSVATATTSAQLVDNTNSFMVGYINFASTEFPGVISNVRMTKGVAVYTANFVPTTSALTATTTVTAAQSWSTAFDGTGDYLSVPSSSAFAIPTSTTPFTIEAWIYPTAAGGAIFCDTYTSGDTIPISVHLSDGSVIDSTNGRVLTLAYYSGSAWTNCAMANTNVTLNSWQHIAAVFTGSTCKLFIGGVDVTKSSSPTPATTWGITNDNGQTWLIGRRWDTSLNPYFIGYISNFRFTKGQALYTSAFTPATSPLTTTSQGISTGTVSLLTCQNNLLQDNSANYFAVTANGDARPASANPFVSNNGIGGTSYSGYFDGNGDYLTVASNAAFGFGTGDFTIEGWWYFTGTIGTYQRPWWFGDDNDNLEISTSVLRVGGASQGTLITGGTTIIAYQWYHIALTRASGVYKLWLNGTQQGSSATNSYNSSARTFTVNATSGGANPVTGYTSNLRITKGQALYTAAFSPTTSPLTTTSQGATAGNVSLLTCQSTTFIDNSSNALTLTAAGNAATQTFNPFSGATSLLTCQSATLTDNSAIVNTISSVGNATAVAQSPFVPRYYSNYFNGASSISVPNTSQATLNVTTGATFTIEAWVNLSSLAATRTIIADNVPGNATAYWYLNINTSGYLNFNWYTGSTVTCTASTTAMAIGTWYHVAMSVNAGSIGLYVNGIQQSLTGTTTLSAPSGNTGTIAVGQYGSPVVYMIGYISNLRITKSQALYTTTFTPATSPLTTTSQGATAANVSLLTCQSPYFIDTGYNLQAVTQNSAPQISGLAPFTQPGTGYTSTPITTYGSGYFDGNGDYLYWSSTPTLPTATTPFTMEAWVYFTAFSGVVIATSAYSSGAIPFVMGMGTGSTSVAGATPFFGYYNGSSWQIIVQTATSLVTNTWYHMAYVYNATTATIYVNGASIGTASATTWQTTAGTAGFYVGRRWDTSSSVYHTGYIADFRFTIGTAVYNANFTPPVAPLSALANTKLLTCQTRGAHNDSDFPDNSRFSNLVTRNGNTTNGSFSPYGANYSVYFDGSSYISTASGVSTAMGTGFAGNIISIEMFVFPTNLNNGSYSNAFIGAYAAVAANGRWIFYHSRTSNSTTSLGFSYTTSTGSQADCVTTATPLNQNQWNHVAVTIDATTSTSATVKIFANGSLIQTWTAQNMSTQTAYYASPNIGGPNSLYVSQFIGYISNLRIMKGVLAYTGNYNVPTSPLPSAAFTALNACQSNRFVDLSAGNYALTPSGSTVTIQKFSPFGTVTPTTYYSGYFDGTGDYLLTATNSAFNLSSTVSWTLEYWVYLTTLATYQQIAFFSAGSSNSWTAAHNIDFGVNTSGNMYIEYATGSSPSIISGATVLSTNTWYHLAYVYNGSAKTITTYVNGARDLNASSMSTYAPSTATPRVTIGRIDPVVSTPTYFVSGYISNFRITNGQALYTANFTPPTSPLTTTSQGAIASNVSLLTCQNNTFVDNSPNYFAITSNGDTKPLIFAPPFYTAYYSNYFDGSGDYLTVSSTANAAFGFGTGDFTVEGWFYGTVDNATDFMIDFRGSVATAPAIFVYTSNQLALYYNGSIRYQPASLTFTFNTWNHVALVRSSGVTKFYLNGTGAATTYTDTNNYPSAACIIGTDAVAGGSSYWTGYMSNIRVTKGQALYTANFTPSTSPLTTTSQGATAANVSLLTCQSPYFIDNSVNIFAITPAGNTAVAATSPFSPSTAVTTVSYSPTTFGGSMYFDGTGDYLSSATPAVGTNSFTYEAWVYSTTTGQKGILSSFVQLASPGDHGILLQVNASNQFSGIIQVSNASTLTLTSSATVTLNVWTHLALTRSGAVCTLWVNGVSAATGTFSGSMTETTVVVGTLYISPSSFYFTGYISDARVVNGAALYTSNFFPGASPATPTYTIGTTNYTSNLLLSGTAGGVVDASRTVDLETVGDAKAVQFSPYSGSYYSYYFGGSDNLNIANTTSLDFGTGDFTVEFWLYAINVPNTAGIIGKKASDATYGWQIYYNSAYTNRLSARLSLTADFTATSSFTIGTWDHWALTRSGTTVRWFKNGVLDNTGTSSANLTETALTYIGYSQTWGGYYTGYISNLRVVKGQALYTSTFTVTTSPLTTTSQGATAANVSLLTCQSNKFVDNSNNALTLTAGGTPKVQPANPFAVNTGTAYYFDGTGDYLSIPTTTTNNLSTGNFTIEFWVNPTTWYGSVYEIGGASQYLVIYRNNSSSTTKMGVRFNNNASSDIFSTADVPVGQWSYWALVRNNGTVTWYCNGVAGGSASYATAIPGGTATLGYSLSFSIAYTGYIADFRLTNGVARYTGNFTPPTAPFKTN